MTKLRAKLFRADSKDVYHAMNTDERGRICCKQCSRTWYYDTEVYWPLFVDNRYNQAVMLELELEDVDSYDNFDHTWIMHHICHCGAVFYVHTGQIRKVQDGRPEFTSHWPKQIFDDAY